LEIVPVEMEGVFSWVLVVEHDVDHLVLFEDEGVGVYPVDGCVVGCDTSG
jgi:hypothetical protein